VFEVTAVLPPQARMADVRDAIEAIVSLMEGHPERAAIVLSTVPVFRAALDGMPAEFAGTFQYPQLYGQLGAMALRADDPATAAALLRRALEIDPHQPPVEADLALAVLASGGDATAEIENAIAESRDPLWNDDPNDPAEGANTVLPPMTARIDEYLVAFPDRVEMVRPLRDAIAAELARVGS
jgi:hypothetical protein